jgi:hypothetical protein
MKKNEMCLKLNIFFLATMFFSRTPVAQDYNVKKLQKLFDKEMTYHKDENTITFETLYPLNISNFEKFQNDVRDSVAIETLFFSIEDDKESLSYLESNKKTRVYPSEREFNRTLFPLDRDVKNLYTRDVHMIFLQFMRIPSDLKPLLNNAISFDDRRIYYETNSEKKFKYSDTLISNTACSIYHNHWKLSEFSDSKHDIPDVLAQVLPILFKENAPYNLTKDQYKAYLDWKSKKLNAELEKRRIDGQIEIIPLFQIDTFEFAVKGTELYNQWDIKKSEYDEFVKYSSDSLVRETLFFELAEWKKANKFIQHPEYYLSEKYLEFVEFDPVDKVENRKLFSLDYKAKIKVKNPEVKKIIISLELMHKKSLMYCFRTLNLKESIDKPSAFNFRSYYNQPWFQIDTNKVEVLPIKKVEPQGTFIQQLNYEQAIAFYTWKYPISKATVNSNWKNYIFPTQEEFLKMQTKSENICPDKSFYYSTNTLKYKVKLF